jgi:UDP-N-acetylglucosamine diphosphorylase / glucose-1-phosphate thymidylyltransferase / UDP-N-acetylgalactosamine diphosphorylase / glucosamine-1-phosphate N-acetyltransferase / galactosamine-1-phosphate N-acetyltransferase
MKNTKYEIRNTKQIRNSKSEIQNHYPLTYLRSVEELRCGARTLADHPKRKIKYLWELIVNLKEDLEEDLRGMGYGVRGMVHPSAVIYLPEKVLIEEGAEIEACAVLDARQGPIYIGQGTIVKTGANLRGPLSIGPECRIGGEVTHSIFHGYSNKAHYGFIGHSYIGEWVNLGAGTTNSNLKNNYGTVKVQVNGKEVDSKQQFLGCFIGDFAKTGIGTLINTGTVIGLGANVLGGRVTPKYIPDFQWDEKSRYRLEDFLKAAGAMMARRNIKLTDLQINKIRDVYDQTIK